MTQLILSWTVKGELVLITDDGTEKHLKNPGDVVIQKGTAHAWKNPGTEWTRLASILIDAKPALVNGQELGFFMEMDTK
jgi:quercetin dioxygenase-like cupin family protein